MSAGFPNKNCNAYFSFYTQHCSQLMHSLWWISNPLVSSNSDLVLLNSLYRDIPLCSSIKSTVNTCHLEDAIEALVLQCIFSQHITMSTCSKKMKWKNRNFIVHYLKETVPNTECVQ